MTVVVSDGVVGVTAGEGAGEEVADTTAVIALRVMKQVVMMVAKGIKAMRTVVGTLAYLIFEVEVEVAAVGVVVVMAIV